MRKMHAKLLSVITVIVIGLSMFSMANAGTPDENKAAGAAYLATNAKKAGISTTASGLQYEVVTKGTGTKNPAATDKVTVHYKGTTIDGKEFDSSYSRGEPIAFGLNQVIPGWTEGVQLMTEGAKYRFYIPSELAYGENGAGGAIGANEALIFDVELIKIN
nr:FKBP-type peptidyl-prolyl cis-trans isomerase [Crenothrix polyspora]